jgi:hypothetical protein
MPEEEPPEEVVPEEPPEEVPISWQAPPLPEHSPELSEVVQQTTVSPAHIKNGWAAEHAGSLPKSQVREPLKHSQHAPDDEDVTPLLEAIHEGGGVLDSSVQVAKLVQFRLSIVPVQHSGLPLTPQNKHSPAGHIIFKPLGHEPLPLVQKAPPEEPPEEVELEEPEEEVVSSLQAPLLPLQLPGLLGLSFAQQATSPVLIIPQRGNGLVPPQSGSLPGSHTTTLPSHLQQAPDELEPPEVPPDEEPIFLQVNMLPLQTPSPPGSVQHNRKLPLVPPQKKCGFEAGHSGSLPAAQVNDPPSHSQHGQQHDW